MIAKILNGDNIRAVLAYNTMKVDGEVAQVLSSNFMEASENVRFNDCLKVLENVLTANKNVRNGAKHIVLNPAENDLSNETLESIAKDYLEEMGWTNQPYMIVKHEDTDKIHLHIVTTNVDFQGNKIDTKFENKRSDKVRIELEKRYNLQPATDETLSVKEKVQRKIDDINNFILDNQVPSSVEYGKKELVKSMRKVLRYVSKNYKYKNETELNRILNQFGMCAETVSGTAKSGEPFNGIMFYALDSDGQRKGGISGSTISPLYSYQKFEEQFTHNTEQHKQDKLLAKNIKEYMSGQIGRTLNNYRQGISYTDFKDIMRNNGIDAQYSINKDGRLLGVSFVNNVKGVVLKLSELDKETQERLRSSLTEQKVMSSLERHLQMKEISEQVRKAYDTIKKRDYYFESDMIDRLDDNRQAIKDEVLKNSTFTHALADECIDNYINFKKDKLSEIRKKEIGYFSVQVESVMKQLAIVAPEKRGDFLLKHNIIFDGKTFYHKKSPSVSTIVQHPTELSDNLNCKDNGDFSKQEKEMLSKFVQGDVSSDNIHARFPFINYLTEEKKREFSKSVTMNYVDNVLNANREQDIRIQLALVQQKGLLVVPQKNADGSTDYFIGRYDDSRRIGYVKLNDRYRKMLDGIDYAKEYESIKARSFDSWGNPSNKYRAMTELGLAIDSKDKSKFDYEVKRIERYNPELATKIKEVGNDKLRLYTLLSQQDANLGDRPNNRRIKK